MDMMLHRLIETLWGKTEIPRASIAAEDAEIGMDNREGAKIAKENAKQKALEILRVFLRAIAPLRFH